MAKMQRERESINAEGAKSPSMARGPLETTSPASPSTARAQIYSAVDAAGDWEIPSERLRITAEIGRGEYGRVCSGKWQGTPVAIKMAIQNAQPHGQTLLGGDLLMREVASMAKLHHPHVVQFLGFSTRAPRCASDAAAATKPGVSRIPCDVVCIVMELFPHRSVEEYVGLHSPHAAKSVPNDVKQRFCAEMAMALAYLHNRMPSYVIHRDIKPSNFMLTSSLRVKLCDFGISRLFSHDAESFAVGADAAPGFAPATPSRANRANPMASSPSPVAARRSAAVPALPPTSTGRPSSAPSRLQPDAPPEGIDQTANCGTVRFMAPEVAVLGSQLGTTATYDTAADVFSLGMVYSFVWERKLPRIAGCSGPGEHIKALREGKRPPHGPSTPKSARQIIDACWVTDTSQRPRAEKLVELWAGQPLMVGVNVECGCPVS